MLKSPSLLNPLIANLTFFLFLANSQQLKFPNNFPKAFPEAPVAGKEVRLECVAFG
jgi:hypothetical protein